MSDAAGGPGAALVVDDSRITRGLLAQILGGAGFASVAQAADGLEALRVLEERTVALVLTDWRMPRADGATLLERMRGDARLKDIPVVVVSSVSDDDAVRAVLDAGARHFIRKPFERATVERVVGEVARVEQLRREGRPALRGVLGGIAAVELVQLLQLTRRTGVLSFAPSGARLDLEDGSVSAARAGAASGEDAFRAVMALRGDSFVFDPAGVRGPRDITRSTTALLVEALRLADESARVGAAGRTP